MARRMVYAFGSFEADTDRFELKLEGAPLPIQRKTFDLLVFLIRKKFKAAIVERAAGIRKDIDEATADHGDAERTADLFCLLINRLRAVHESFLPPTAAPSA